MFGDQNAPGGFFMPQDGGGANQGNGGGYGGGGGGGYGGGNNNQQNPNMIGLYNNSTNMGGQPAQERRKAKVFTPVTVKMVANSQPRPDDVCEYDGDPINDIILCGRILRRIEEPMRTQFEINDNTGTFYILFYHKGENQVPTALRNFHYEQFTYVKVYGNIRVFKEEKAIVGTHIKRIEKFDELTNHFLSVYVSHCIRKKGILKPRELQMNQGAQEQGQKPGQTNMSNMNNNYSANRQNENGGGGSHNSNHAPGGPGDKNGQFDLRRAIIEVMKQMTKTQKFVNKQQLYQLLQDKVNQNQFEGEMDKMMNDGEICTAFDQNHFCLTN